MSHAMRNKRNAPPFGAMRAQASVEVLVYVSFFLLIFVVLNLFLVMQVGQDIKQREDSFATAIAGQVSDYINVATLAGPGFSGTFAIPRTINGNRYGIMAVSSGSTYILLYNATGGVTRQYYFPNGIRNIGIQFYNYPNLVNGTYSVDGTVYTWSLYNYTATNLGRIVIRNTATATGSRIMLSTT